MARLNTQPKHPAQPCEGGNHKSDSIQNGQLLSATVHRLQNKVMKWIVVHGAKIRFVNLLIVVFSTQPAS